ncbi:MAG: hypothetical protein AYK22_07885 [Thermoplasmatales archaeon SG8-52-3]|nr:MAG: hypothetical protein AYK22_07885 [Thermoplasmatales archaeon SG8-52-3]
MNKKFLGIFICTLLIVTVGPISTGLAEKSTYKEATLDRVWYWVESYPNYAPSGMPDFDLEQGEWKGIIDGGNGIADSTAQGDDVQIVSPGGLVDPDAPSIIAPGPDCYLDSNPSGDDIEVWIFSNAISTINCLWWFDSRFADPDGTPGDGEDIYPLIADYGAGDDHSATNAPLSIERMANAMDITSTLFLDNDVWIDTINWWFANVSLEDKLEVNFYDVPTFEFVADEIQEGKAVILIINFVDDSSGDCEFVGNHAVTCTGVNSAETKIAFCDPLLDINNPSDDDHNDTQFVSKDVYLASIGSPCENHPEIEWWLPSYPSDYNYSVIYSAIVIEYINNPPSTPTIDGPTNGVIDTPYTYTFNSVDPDAEDELYYYILWDDGYVENWEGPFASGEDFEIDHTYTKEGTFTIQAKAKDNHNVESGVAELEVTMPRVRSFRYNFNLLDLLFESFPNAFPILRQLLGFD